MSSKELEVGSRAFTLPTVECSVVHTYGAGQAGGTSLYPCYTVVAGCLPN